MKQIRHTFRCPLLWGPMEVVDTWDGFWSSGGFTSKHHLLKCLTGISYSTEGRFNGLVYSMASYWNWAGLGYVLNLFLPYFPHLVFFFFVCVCVFCFLGLHLQHMEVPRLGVGVEVELQWPAHTTATATPDPSLIFELHHSSWQRWILDPLSEAKDWSCILPDTSQVCNPLSHSENSLFSLLWNEE